MCLFTPTDRETIKTDLVNLLTATSGISAIILIGSAVTGYTDELSDIDIMSVVSDETDIVNVMDVVSEGTKSHYNVLCFAQLSVAITPRHVCEPLRVGCHCRCHQSLLYEGTMRLHHAKQTGSRHNRNLPMQKQTGIL